jgi:hypothetical protein
MIETKSVFWQSASELCVRLTELVISAVYAFSLFLLTGILFGGFMLVFAGLLYVVLSHYISAGFMFMLGLFCFIPISMALTLYIALKLP